MADDFGIAPTTSTLTEVKRPGLVFRPAPAGLPPVYTVLAWRRADDSPIIAHFRACFLNPAGAVPRAPLRGRKTPSRTIVSETRSIHTPARADA